MSDEFAQHLVELYKERNRIHLELDKEEDISKLDFTQDNVDTLGKALNELADLLCKNAKRNYPNNA